jgi:hypothetical protein
MKYDEWIAIYEEMKAVFERDKELTNIELDFKIKPITTEKKIARITITTYKNENRTN